MSRSRAALETVLASMIWGLAFIAVHDVLRVMSPLWLVASRFLLAAGLVLPWFLLTPRGRAKLHPSEMKGAALAGLMLVATITLQTFGLRLTTATNSGFITTLYALFVPFVAYAWLGQRPTAAQLVLLAIALVGTALMCGFPGGALNLGDALTLACAVTGALHIVLIARVAPHVRSPLAFNAMQGLVAGALALVLALLVDGVPAALAFGPREAAAYAFLVVISSILAFLMQIRAQRVLPPQLSSMLFLLESPFAAFFAFWLLGERLGVVQWGGGAMILVAAVVAVRSGARDAPSSTTAMNEHIGS